MVPTVISLGTWGQRWTRRTLAEGEVDLTLFLWAFERSVDTGAFRRDRTVVQFEFRDQPAAKRRWWFVNEPDYVQLCVDAPGFDVDVFVSSTLRTLIAAWRGDTPLRKLLRDQAIQVDDATRLVRAFPRWFGSSSLAHIGPAVSAPTGARSAGSGRG